MRNSLCSCGLNDQPNRWTRTSFSGEESHLENIENQTRQRLRGMRKEAKRQSKSKQLISNRFNRNLLASSLSKSSKRRLILIQLVWLPSFALSESAWNSVRRSSTFASMTHGSFVISHIVPREQSNVCKHRFWRLRSAWKRSSVWLMGFQFIRFVLLIHFFVKRTRCGTRMTLCPERKTLQKSGDVLVWIDPCVWM